MLEPSAALEGMVEESCESAGDTKTAIKNMATGKHSEDVLRMEWVRRFLVERRYYP